MKQPLQFPDCPNPKVPATDHAFFHELKLQVRFSDIDILGHINNSVYLQFMDLGKADYFTRSTGQRVELGGLSLAIVNINCDFFSPAYFNEPLSVITRVSSVSTHSLRMEQRIVNPLTGDVKCIGRTVLAGFDPRTASGTTLPGELVSQIEAFEGRNLRKNY